MASKITGEVINGLRHDLGQDVKWKSLPTESCAPSHPLQVSDSPRLSGKRSPWEPPLCPAPGTGRRAAVCV